MMSNLSAFYLFLNFITLFFFLNVIFSGLKLLLTN